MSPILKINGWLAKETELGSVNPNRGILATAGHSGIPHGRVVAIREVTDEGVLFFTQKNTQKVCELIENPLASMVFWLPMQQRQVILDGRTKELTLEENEYFWKTIPRGGQLRFSAYAPTSGRVINSMDELDKRYSDLQSKFENNTIPMSEFYCGFRLDPDVMKFYTLGIDAFSEVVMYTKNQNGWVEQTLSP